MIAPEAVGLLLEMRCKEKTYVDVSRRRWKTIMKTGQHL